MTNGNIYVMVGLPASGKSTYTHEKTQENKNVLSSDTIRKELFGDEAFQKNNTLVFSTLFERLSALQRNKTEEIYIDATSISSSDRRKLLNTIKRGNTTKMVSRVGNHVELERFYRVTAVVFQQDVNVLIQRDVSRGRTVGEKVIMRMLARFVPPSLGEGFNEIIHIPAEEYKNEREDEFVGKLEKFIIGDLDISSVLKTDIFLSKSLDCEQNSQWHQETLLEHLEMILEIAEESSEQQDLKILKILTLFHDIGKPFVRSKKSENLIRRGYTHVGGSSFQKKNGTPVDIPSYNDYQFIDHENFGANIFNSNYKKILTQRGIITQDEAQTIEIIIRGHLVFHENNGKTSIMIGGIKYESDTEIFRLGTLFSYCDGKGRIGINDIKK